MTAKTTLTVAEKATKHVVEFVNGVYEVLSATSETVYKVAAVEGGLSCSCKFGEHNPVMVPGVTKVCSHVLAAYNG